MNLDILLETLSTFAECNATPGHGVTRFSWSDADLQARKLITGMLEELDLSAETDGIGNIRATLKGKYKLPAVIIGSHLDTVHNGGAFDGIYGVAAALETLRSISERKTRLDRPVTFIAFAEEEGSNYGCTCLGSKAVTGGISQQELRALPDSSGNLWKKLETFGLKPQDLPNQQFNKDNGRAYLEVHIEQNDRLEQLGKDIGIVEAIYGMRLFSFTFTGSADHAASPRTGRRDPMAAFARFASDLENLWLTEEFGADFSFTIGKIDCQPNVGIISPEKVIFTLDLRHIDVSFLENSARRILDLAKETAKAYGVKMERKLLSASGGATLDKSLAQLCRELADQNNYSWMDMVSWPAHDAACMAQIMPAALIFVPSARGLSHCPEEYTDPAFLGQGAQLLEEMTCRLAMKK